MKPELNPIERRYIDASELRAVVEDGKPVLSGYSALFNVLSEDLGGFREQVAPGCFAETIRSDDIKALWNHNADHVLGRNVVSKTLQLAEDDRGLKMRVDLPDTQTARDLHVSIGRGDITQQSFGFRTISDKWETRQGQNFRTLLKARLFDVSPVTYPAYPSTDVTARKLALDCAGVDPDLTLAAIVRLERSLEPFDGDDALLRKAGELLQGLERRRAWTPDASNVIRRLRLELEAAAV